MNARKEFVRGNLEVAVGAVVLAFAVTGLNREKNHTDGKEGATPSGVLSDDSAETFKGRGEPMAIGARTHRAFGD